MKILQLIQKKQLRGAEIFAAQLSSHLIEQGHHVIIVSLIDGEAKLPFQGKIISLNVNIRLKMIDVTGWKKLADLIADFCPDIIQANAGDTLKYAIFSKKLFRWNQPIVFRNASMISNYARGFFSKKLISYLLNNTKHIIAVSDTTKQDLVNHFNISSKKIIAIPVGIELQSYKSIAAFDNNKINLVHVGGFSFEKNHKGLLSIFKKLLSKNGSFQLWLLGDGPLRKKIEDLAFELGLAQHVHFLGFVDNPIDYINAADMLLLPSIIEGLPGVILEAFYCKTLVVANDVGAISELIIDHKTGRLIKKEDETSFVEAIMTLYSMDPSLKLNITTLANEVVMRDYINKINTQKFIDLYSSLTLG